MANIKSQLKRIKTNEKSHERNKATKSALKTSIRRFREAADAGDSDKAKELAYAASRALDKAASKGVIHKNQAANRKSAIASQAAGLADRPRKKRPDLTICERRWRVYDVTPHAPAQAILMAPAGTLSTARSNAYAASSQRPSRRRPRRYRLRAEARLP